MLDSESAVDAKAVRNHTKEIVLAAGHADHPVLIEAPPTSGKTTSAYELVNETGTPVTYLAGRTDLYEEAKAWAAKQLGLTVEAIPSPQRNCPTFRGENDGEQAKAEQMYSKGLSGADVHYHPKVYTPCHSEDGADCEYMETRTRINRLLESNEIDFLIGNHKHGHQSKYIDDRLVVLDEFNADVFLQYFPSDGDIDGADHSGEIIGYFLDQLSTKEGEFPVDVYGDPTDILQYRSDSEPLAEALSWFEENGVSRHAVESFDFYNVSTFRHDPGHKLAPLLTLCLLCMRKVGDGIEVAPPPDEYDVPEIRDTWDEMESTRGIRCVRNRNTGKVVLLRPPDLTPARQVIGLDGLPSKDLWELVYHTGSGFDHRKIISRSDFSEFISEALDMSVKQITDARHPYAGGRISPYDEVLFEIIHTLEGREFPLISTKKALDEYAKRGWLDRFVKRDVENYETEEMYEEGLAAMNYARVVSSNVFEKEDLGVVSGAPFPGYDVLRIWAGFCGEAIDTSQDDEPSFEAPVDGIYNHLSKHQVIQAMLRFGRHEDVWGDEGSTVYLNTAVVPDWFNPKAILKESKEEKAGEIIEYLIRAKRTDERTPLVEQNVRSIVEELDIDRGYVRDILNSLKRNDLVKMTPDKGKHGSDLYEWVGNEELRKAGDALDAEFLLEVDDKIYFLDT